MKTLKRIGSFLLALIMVLSMIPATHTHAASVASGYCGDPNVNDGKDVTWALDDTGVLTISGAGAMKNYLYGGATPWYSQLNQLYAVVITDGVTSIGDYAFSDSRNLTGVTIPDGVTIIGKNAFYSCYDLDSVTIPDSVTTIGAEAFSYCYDLTSITIPKSVTSIGVRAFDNCRSMTGIRVEENNPAFSSDSYGVLFNKNKTNLIQAPYTISGNYTIPDSVAVIGTNAFYGCSSMTNVVIPNGVTTLETYAFSGCTGLTGVTIPGSVTTMGGNVFGDCYGLTSVTIEEGVTTIGDRAFISCSKLTEVTLPNSVTTIGEAAFSSTKRLACITIPDSVTLIKDGAFYDCPALNDVYYGGAKAQWDQIDIDDDNDPLTGANIHYNACQTGHAWVAANCTAAKTCSSCSATQGSALGHSWVAANCTTAKTCSSCGATQGEARGHTWQAAGCTELRTCSACGETETEAVGHTWVDADCDTPQTCSVCDTTEGEALGHSWQDANCTASKTCSVCGETDGEADLDAHSFVDGVCKYCGILGGQCGSDMIWTLDDVGKLTIAGSGTMNYFSNESQVPWKNYVAQIFDVVIEDGVTSVSHYAFSGCSSMMTVTIPDSVTSFGIASFEDCSKLSSVVIPGNVKSISTSMFYGCKSLTSITLPDSVTSIGSSAFFGCSKLENFTIPSGVTHIDSYAFRNCSNLTNIEIPDSVLDIGISAFYNCNNLTEIDYVGNSNAWQMILAYSSFSDNPLEGNSKDKNLYLNGELVTSIDIPDGVTSIGSNAFYTCSSLKSVTIPNSVEEIGSCAFYGCRNLTEIIIPDSVTAIGNSAFERCYSVTSVSVGKGLKTVGMYAFQYCTALTDVYAADIASWLNISFSAYASSPLDANDKEKKLYINGMLIKDMVIPDGITSVPAYAFCNCSSLESVTIPKSVASIGRSAFDGCSGLTEIEIPNGVTNIGYNAFNGCSALTDIIVPDSVEHIDGNAFNGCSGLKSITLPFVGADKKIASNATEYPFGYIFGAPEYEGSIAVIQTYYGSNSTSGTSTYYYLPEGLTSVTITGDEIPRGAFSGCRNLTSITLPVGLNIISDSAFENCDGLRSIVIPDGVKSIGAKAFYDCDAPGLSTVILPDSIVSIGESAFYSCSGLSKVIYCGTESQWNAITVGTNNVELTNATRQHHDYPEAGCTDLRTCNICGETETEARGHNYADGVCTVCAIPDGLQYYVGGAGGILITGYTGTAETLVIPSVIDGIGGIEIESGAFNNCTMLKNIYIPSSVRGIAWDTFTNCDIENVYFGGSQENWESVYSGQAAADYVHYDCDSTDIEGHWAEGETVPATCTTGAYTIYLCTCNHEKNVTVDEPNGHTWVAATCTTPKTCSACGATEGEALNHPYENGTCTGCGKVQPAATITAAGGKQTEYDTLEEAAKAAADGDTITLNAHVKIQKALTFSSGNITLDLNKYQLDVAEGCLYDVPIINIQGATLTIQGSNVVWDNSSNDHNYTVNDTSCNISVSSGKLILDHAKVYSCSKEYAIVVHAGASAELKGADCHVVRNYGTVTVNDSTVSKISNSDGTVYMESGKCNIFNAGTAYIRGGTVTGALNYNDCLMEVSGGTVSGINNYGHLVIKDDAVITGKMLVTATGTAAISGGTFTDGIALSQNYKKLSDLLAEGYVYYDGICAYSPTHPLVATQELTGNPDVTVVPAEDKIVASRTDAEGNVTYYVSVEEALLAGSEGTVTLLADATLGYNVSVGTTENLDLNGKKLTVPEDHTLKVQGILMMNGGSVDGTYSFGTNSGGIGGACGENAWWKLEKGVLTVYGSGDMTSAPWPKEDITTAIIEEGITSICESAFEDCENLTSVTIPDTVATLGSSCFYGCKSLASVDLPEGITTIPYEAFAYCWALTSLEIPQSVTTIGGRAFYYSREIVGMQIPEKVTSIGTDAFTGCSKLEFVRFNGNAPTLGSYTFRSLTLKAFYPGYDTTWTAAVRKPYGGSVTWVAYDQAHTEHSFDANGLCSCGCIGGTCGENAQWALDPATGTLYISGAGKMEDYDSSSQTPWAEYKGVVRKVVVEEGITHVGGCAFKEFSNLEEISLPDSLKSIGSEAIMLCTKLKEIEIPSKVTAIGGYAFEQCYALESVVLPEGLTTISSGIFNRCTSLKTVTIPASVTSIGISAFNGCSSLTDVYYGSNEKAWNQVTIGSYNTALQNATIHYTDPCLQGHNEICGVCSNCGIGLNLQDYQYTLDEAAGAVTLTDYIGSGTDVHVAAAYLLEGKQYQTLLEATSVFKGNTAITSVTIDDGVTIASDSMEEMFYGCASLKTADLAGLDTTGVTSLRRLFSECKKLVSADVTGWDTSAVEDMSYLFDYCSALTTITGYENWNTGSVWNLSKAFNRTSAIDKVDLSQWNLSQITNSGWCFQMCYAEEILLPDNLAVMSAGFFNHPAYFAGSTFTIPSGVKKIGYAHTIYDFGTDDFSEFIVPEDNGYYQAVDGILYSMDGTELIAIPRGKTFENGVFEIPNTVTFMGELSFSRNYNIETLVLPDNFIIEYVPLYAPRYILEDGHGGNDTGNLNSGTNLSIAIYCYTGITKYDVRDTNTHYEAIDGVIYSEDMTTLVAVPARYAQHLNIPEGVTTWNKEALWADLAGNPNLLSLLENCTGVSIPSTLTEIDAEQLSMLNSLADRTSSAFTITVAEGNRTFHVNPTTGHLETHSYSQVVTDPTCEDQGYTTHTCATCGDSYNDNYTEAKSHSWVAANCTNPKTCNNCGETEGDPIPNAHIFTDGACSVCGILGGQCGNSVFWSYKDGKLCVYGTGAMTNFDSPAQAPWYGYRTAVQSVVIEDGITGIGNYAFCVYPNLAEATIADSVAEIGNNAFAGCAALTEITIPAGVTSIKTAAFSATGLTHVIIPQGVRTIWDHAFQNCDDLAYVVIPESVVNINAHAFNGCDSLWHVLYAGTEQQWNDISILRLNDELLAATRHFLTGSDVLVESDKHTCTDQALLECTVCQAILTTPIEGGQHTWTDATCVAPKTCSSCGETEGEIDPYGHSFANGACKHCGILGGQCGDEAYWMFSGGKLTVYGSGEMYDYQGVQVPWGSKRPLITQVEVIDGVTSVGDYAFNACSGLTTLTLADSVIEIGQDTFAFCSNLQTVDLGNGLEQFGYYAFRNCTSLKELTIPGSIRSCGESAFQDCTALESVTFGDGAAAVGMYMFQGCTALKTATLPDSITYLADAAFRNCGSLESITIPAGVKDIGIYAFENCTSLKTVQLQEGLERIGGYAFYGCEKLQDVQLPASVNRIDESAFAFCAAITALELPQGLTSIGFNAFDRSGLTSITVPGTVTELYGGTFYGCENLTVAVLEEGVTTLYSGVFRSCTDLHTLVLPKTITQISDGVLEDTNVTDLYYGGSQDAFAPLLTKVSAQFIHYNCTQPEGHWTEVTKSGNCTQDSYTCDGCPCGYERNIRNVQTAPGHDWLAADCETAKTCKVCGATEGEAPGHDWRSATCMEPKHCGICGTTQGDPLPHEWKAADCNNPETCGTCGTTRGEPLDHSWVDATCTAPKTCSSCGETEGEATGHAWIDATCYSLKTCNNCGITEGSMLEHDWQAADCLISKHCKNCTATEGTALGHDWTQGDCTNPKSCRRCFTTEGTAPGHSWVGPTCYAPKTCSSCGAIDSVAWGHNWLNATCTTPETCSICGETRAEAFGHAWVDATCKEPKTCIRCDETEGEALGHDWMAADCTNPKHCKNCAATEGEALGHDWLAATCVTPETCTSCGATRGEVLPHTPVVDPAVEATCTTAGKTEGSHCSGCLKTLVAQQTVPAKQHTWKSATCVAPKTCTVCGSSEGKALGHTVVIDKAVEATCTETGLTEGKYCSVCSEILVAQQTVPVKQHTWQNATCDSPKTCSVCGGTQGDALGHNWKSATCTENASCQRCGEVAYGTKLPHTEAVVSSVAATCTTVGKTEGKYCSVCGTVTKAQQTIPAKGHTEVIDKTVAATCTTIGKTEGSHCGVCNAVIAAQQTIPAKGHASVPDAAVAATCTTAGKTSGSHCKTCGEVIMAQVVIPATGHSWLAGNCTTPKTCKACGIKEGGVVHAYEHQYDYKCDSCGAERTVDMTRPMVDMFRMYNPNTGEHFYTGSTVERDNLISVGWQYEGIGFTFPLTTGLPVHRLFQPSTGEHLYTMDESEKAKLMADGWNYEGIAFNSGFENEVPQYRLHNPNATVGAYHFTASAEERDTLLAAGWEYQGIGWYSLGA